MKTITVYFKRAESPTRVDITGEGYDYAVEDSVLEIDSEVPGEPDYIFNWSEVLYVKMVTTT